MGEGEVASVTISPAKTRWRWYLAIRALGMLWSIAQLRVMGAMTTRLLSCRDGATKVVESTPVFTRVGFEIGGALLREVERSRRRKAVLDPLGKRISQNLLCRPMSNSVSTQYCS